VDKDTQLVELAGRHWLIGQLVTFGFEVATPIRDRGVDLIVYQEQTKLFRALPVQLKAASYRTFSINAKYQKTSNLVLVYVWDVRPGASSMAYAMTVAEAVGIGDAMEYTKTASWAKGSYATTNPSKKLISLLAPFASSRERWQMLIRQQASIPPDAAPR
jgi:hypothetical protein